MTLKKVMRWLRRLFWHEPLHVDEVIDDHVMVTYCGVEITLRRDEKLRWDRMNRQQRNAMAEDVRRAQRHKQVQILQDKKGRRITVKKRP